MLALSRSTPRGRDLLHCCRRRRCRPCCPGRRWRWCRCLRTGWMPKLLCRSCPGSPLLLAVPLDVGVWVAAAVEAGRCPRTGGAAKPAGRRSEQRRLSPCCCRRPSRWTRSSIRRSGSTAIRLPIRGCLTGTPGSGSPKKPLTSVFASPRWIRRKSPRVSGSLYCWRRYLTFNADGTHRRCWTRAADRWMSGRYCSCL